MSERVELEVTGATLLFGDQIVAAPTSELIGCAVLVSAYKTPGLPDGKLLVSARHPSDPDQRGDLYLVDGAAQYTVSRNAAAYKATA